MAAAARGRSGRIQAGWAGWAAPWAARVAAASGLARMEASWAALAVTVRARVRLIDWREEFRRFETPPRV